MDDSSQQDDGRRFRALIEHGADGVALIDGERRILYANPALEQLFDIPRAELLGMAVHGCFHASDRPRVRAALTEIAEQPGASVSLDCRVASARWASITFTNFLSDPAVGAIVASVRDVTERKRADDRAQEREYFLEEAQAIAHVGSWVFSFDGSERIEWSKECRRIFGLSQTEPTTLATFYDHVHPDDRPRVKRSALAMRERGQPYSVEHRIVRRDGVVRWLHARGVLERDEAGTPTRILGTAQDVTETRQWEEERRISADRYRRIVEGTTDGVTIVDHEMVFVFVNARFAEMLGYEAHEILGHSALEFFDDETQDTVRRKLAMRRAGIADTYELRFRRKDGTPVWTLLRGSPIFDEEGRVEGSLAIITDINERRREQEVRNRLAAIVEGSDDAIFSVDLRGAVTSWNQAAERLFQYEASEILGRLWCALIPPELLGEEEQVLEAVAHGKPIARRATRRVRKDGTLVDVLISVSPIRDAAGAILGASKIARDLTEYRKTEEALKRSEEQLRQALKMEAIGSLAGGVAHDFNNLLTVILSYVILLEENLPPDDPRQSDIAEIRQASERAASLTSQLLAFSRKQVLQPRVIDLNEIVAGVERMLGRLLREDIELSTATEPRMGDVFADPGQLEQVIVNVAVNARDAMPSGGKLTITTASATLDDGYVAEHLGVTPGPYVVLTISDTGSGMDEATQARIFEPFFTTKEKGKGTGLGLSTVFGIVQQSGGHIDVKSAPGQGSTFRFYFPRVHGSDAPAAIAPAPAPAAATLARGSETILLAEDEEQVRSTVEHILRRYGYTVLGAASGQDALALCEKHDGTIDLLLTDVVMPRMNGRQLAERFASLRPAARVVFMSGYTEDAIVHDGVGSAGIAFLQKPVVPDALLRKLREVLDGGDGKHA